MTSESDILEDILKNQKQIDAQIRSAEQELAALDEKRKALQAKIDRLKGQKQVIADEQLPFGRQYESNVTNESTQKCKLLFFGLCSEEGKMSTQDALKASAPEKAGTSRFVEMSGSDLFVKNPKSNAVTAKTGILCRSPTMSFETT